MEIILKLDNIEGVVNKILKKVGSNNKKEATILSLSGDLGTGKTTLTQEISRQLGVIDNVISPTFVIMKIYKTKDEKFKKLFHIDAYRLDNDEDLLKLRWEEIIKDKDNLIIIEWPERVPLCIPRDAYSVKIEHKDDTTRFIKF